MASKKNKTPDTTIALNKKSRHDYHLEDTFEAGIMLEGWEVKSLRAGKCHITDSYVLIKNGEAWLLGAHIDPLQTVSTHRFIDPIRTRKLLLHKKELAKILAAITRKGYTCVCTKLYWKKHLVKVVIATAKGKQSHDKRESKKTKDWNLQKQRLLKTQTKR